jgi:hypothetical protein
MLLIVKPLSCKQQQVTEEVKVHNELTSVGVAIAVLESTFSVAFIINKLPIIRVNGTTLQQLDLNEIMNKQY